jgi:hypothetical protein
VRPVKRAAARRDSLTGPFTGPPTSDQLMGLRELEYLAEMQGSVFSTALARVRRGPAGTRVRMAALPWPLFIILAVQIVLSARLLTSNTAFTDEATYLYVGSQELHHWIHGTPVVDYQTFLSGAPVIYPPLAAIVGAVGGLVAVRVLSLFFMLGTTALLYATAKRLLDVRVAVLGSALFAGLAGTQFLGALATYDAMALFLLVLATYLAVGRENAYDTLTDVTYSSVIAAFILALANADKYTTTLWDPVVAGLAICAPVRAGYPWRSGIDRGLRLTGFVAIFITAGLAVGKAKYIQGIMTTTVARSSSQAGMGQPPSLVLHLTWQWIGVVIVPAALGTVLACIPENNGGKNRPSAAARASFILMIALLAVASLLAPLNQARIGTTISLQKHVIFGAWFGCIAAGYALSRVLRFRAMLAVGACALLVVPPALSMPTANVFYEAWPTENMAFIAGLKSLVKPGGQKYLIAGYYFVPAYYVGDVYSLQWKEVGGYSYTDPRTGKYYYGAPAFADAIKNRVFTLIILNFADSGPPDNGPAEPADDYLIAADIAKYGGYQVMGHLPPSDSASDNYYTVWRVTEG